MIQLMVHLIVQLIVQVINQLILHLMDQLLIQVMNQLMLEDFVMVCDILLSLVEEMVSLAACPLED